MDVVVTVPQARWKAWITEGDLPGEPWSRRDSYFSVARLPRIEPGERVYVVSHGRLRGYAPLHALQSGPRALVRRGEAVAVTIQKAIAGFRGVRYRWWSRIDEMPFPEWRTP